MAKSLSAERPRELVRLLRRLAAERAPAEVEIPRQQAEQQRAADRSYLAVRDELTEQFDAELAAAQADYATRRREIVARHEPRLAALQAEYERICREAEDECQEAEKEARRKHHEARWEATSVYEAAKDGPQIRLKETQDQLAARRAELQRSQEYAIFLVRRRRQPAECPPVQATAPTEEQAAARFLEMAEGVRQRTRELHYQRLPALFEGGRPAGLVGGLFVLWALICGLAFGWSGWLWIALTVPLTAGTAGLLLWWLYGIARRQTEETLAALCQSLAEADLAARRLLETAQAAAQRESRAIAERLERSLKEAEDAFSTTLALLHRRRADRLKQAELKYPAEITELTIARERELERLEDEQAARLRALESRFERAMTELNERCAEATRQREEHFSQRWDAMSSRWHAGMAEAAAGSDQLSAACDRLFPPWDTGDFAPWRPPDEPIHAVPFGACDLRLAEVEGGLPRDPRLATPRTEFSLPALAPFPDRPLLLRASGEGRAAAVAAIRAIMLRMLTSFPPGKVRFMIIDPVGLGENFSAFMHLADFDEQLISSRIWTEGPHIDRRLADLTEHMENVLQVYLRNEFASIRQYNDMAGEMAEPYRVLVVANFPVNFSEDAARRLLSIVSSGARCGVYTLMSVDPTLKMPHDFKLADLESAALQVRWQDGRFTWDDPDFADLPLELIAPPAPERFTELVRLVGRRVADAGRVEVPFRCVVPDPEAVWKGDARRGIELPLGRAGAMKLQHLTLGRGTSQHVLVAGKTGSGKSNLLHAVITNAALWYAPDEVELYLIDFKKGVEFKDYAQYHLPHARVIAIESEREFGLSVLQRLDDELRRRGDLFRAAGVSDLPGCREARPEEMLPRVLLIIDEFQELFVEDDRIGQQAALLLDRLVRQGRAFGMHVLLGSQTLAGAYSLPRATMGQMAVRIALQCSESDAHLILSEANTAARLLTRPGEAIYNDANGLYEGNHPFQIVWLPESERADWLQRIQQTACRQGVSAPPPIVFEGNAAADPATNAALEALLAAPGWPEGAASPQVWLGAAVAIKEPSSVRFVRQGGSNLALVGQRDESAAGILVNCLLSLAAQVPPHPGDGPATFYLLDGARADAPEAGFWQRVAPALPHAVRVVEPRHAADAVAEIAAELARRQRENDEDARPVFLLVYNLARFRDLRRDEDDFGFGRGDDRLAAAGRQFAEILREGPPLGIHTLLWCDTYNNLTRALDRAGLRELELRVLFQMNAADSSNLIDAADAGKLGPHRALLYDEALGQIEKFRPYGLPSAEWLEQVGQRLRARNGGEVCPGDSPGAIAEARLATEGDA